VLSVPKQALQMLRKYHLCDHCLGRQFALLGHNLQNADRGKALKMALTMDAHASMLSKKTAGISTLSIIATNGFFEPARQVLIRLKKPIRGSALECYLCEGRFERIENLTNKALKLLDDFEYGSFLVGTELPPRIAEREDEFKAEFEVSNSESMRNEFGRLIGKRIAERNGKLVDFKKPEIVVLVKPISEDVRLQVNALFISGRYRKLVRGMPQSKWFCSSCHGKGCEKCGFTGKMYSESVEEVIGKPCLDESGGSKTSFHASGREDIDARMLGSGRPFVIEITKPRKRFLDLIAIQAAINAFGKGKVEVSEMRFANKDTVRELKRGESTQKEYRVTIEFAKRVTMKDLETVREKLTNVVIHQKTPNRVLHRRADLTRERYIYEVNVKKMASKTAEMRIRCQGGLYVKELVSGDEGRTTPSVSEILGNDATPVKLDVLNIIMEV
jgi:tRNA pseudouridine synthase 10